MEFIIVKNAGESWIHYFMEDPKGGDVHPSYSCHETFSAKLLEIKPSYSDMNEAETDCVKLNTSNPVGDYAVCRLKQK